MGRQPSPIILNTVSRIDTVLVQFFITESQYLMFARRHMEEIEKGKYREGEKADLELILSDGSVYSTTRGKRISSTGRWIPRPAPF